MQVVLLSLGWEWPCLEYLFRQEKRGIGASASSRPHGGFWLKSNRLETIEILNVKWNYKGDDSRARVHCYIRDGEYTAEDAESIRFVCSIYGRLPSTWMKSNM